MSYAYQALCNTADRARGTLSQYARGQNSYWRHGLKSRLSSDHQCCSNTSSTASSVHHRLAFQLEIAAEAQRTQCVSRSPTCHL